MINVIARVVAPVHITLSLLCGEQKTHNPARLPGRIPCFRRNLYAATAASTVRRGGHLDAVLIHKHRPGGLKSPFNSQPPQSLSSFLAPFTDY
jgi:hypothetical protein